MTPILRELLRGLLGFLPHVTVVGEAADGIEAVQLVARHYPDTVLLDIRHAAPRRLRGSRGDPKLSPADPADASHGRTGR